MPAPIRVAIIGCGEVGATHAGILAAMDTARPAAYCDTDAQRAASLLQQFGGNYSTSDPDRIMRDDAIDAVYILTHHNTHSTLAIAAAAAGKHVLIEKPLALTLPDCYAVGNAVEKSGITLMTAFKLRYYKSVQKAKAFMPEPIVSAGQMMDSRWPDDFWANDPVRGGGNVLSQGCHTMDLLYYLNASEPVRIYAEGGNFTHPSLPIIDNIVATIRFANGHIASVVQGDGGATPKVSKFSFQMMDGRKSVHLYNRLKSATFFDGQHTTELHDDEEGGFVEENRDFIHALQTGSAPPITHRDGLRATLLLLKAFESIKTGLPQTVTL